MFYLTKDVGVGEFLFLHYFAGTRSSMFDRLRDLAPINV